MACSLFYLVESVSLIVFYQGYVREEKIGVIQVLFPGISRAAELLRKNMRGRILLFSLLNALLTLSPMLFVFAVQFKVPAYIARTVASRTYGGIAIFLFLIICLLVNFFGVYSLYYCVLSEDNFSTGFKKSSKVVWKYRYQFIFSLLGQNLLLAVFYAVLYVGVLVLVCYIIYCTKSEQVLMAAMLTAYDEVMIYMGIFITVTAQIVNYAALARMFSKYGVMEVAVSFPPNRIEKIQEQIVYEDAVRQMEYAEAEKIQKKLSSRYTRLTAAAQPLYLSTDTSWRTHSATVPSPTGKHFLGLILQRTGGHRGMPRKILWQRFRRLLMIWRILRRLMCRKQGTAW